MTRHSTKSKGRKTKAAPAIARGYPFVLGENVPRASVWVVVDYETGVSVVASPDGFTPRRVAELARAAREGGLLEEGAV